MTDMKWRVSVILSLQSIGKFKCYIPDDMTKDEKQAALHKTTFGFLHTKYERMLKGSTQHVIISNPHAEFKDNLVNNTMVTLRLPLVQYSERAHTLGGSMHAPTNPFTLSCCKSRI